METLAELLGIAAFVGNETVNQIGVLVKDHMRYRQMVRPGDDITLIAEVTVLKSNIVRGNVKAIKEGKLAVEGEITFALIDIPYESTDS